MLDKEHWRAQWGRSMDCPRAWTCSTIVDTTSWPQQGLCRGLKCTGLIQYPYRLPWKLKYMINIFFHFVLDLGPTLHPSCEGSLTVSLLFGWASSAQHGFQSPNHPVEDPILHQWALTQSASSWRMQWLEGQLLNYMFQWILHGWWLMHDGFL